VDQPVVSSRLLGPDGLRGTGARLSWLMPTSSYSELTFGVQNAAGETAFSFLSTEEEEEGFAGRPLDKARVASPEDLLYSLRWLGSFATTPSSELSLGLSTAWGPNATGPDSRTRLAGLDLYLKWQPEQTERGWPFVTWQTEVMYRDYEAGEFEDAGTGEIVAAESLGDWGAYTQVVWGFRRGFTLGLRLDHAEGDESLALDVTSDPFRDRRNRYSAALTWFPSEFSKLRFQYDHDRAEFLEVGPGRNGEHSLWIQWELTLGAHAAHAF